MQLHWAPRLWGPALWCVGVLLLFFQMTLALDNSVATAYKSHCQQTTLSLDLAMNFLYYRTLANVHSSRAKALYLRSTMVA